MTNISIALPEQNPLKVSIAASPTVQASSPNLMQIKDYIYSSEAILGRGSMSVVYKAVNMSSKEVVAIKKIPTRVLKSEHLVASLLDEINIHRKISHHNILSLKEVIRCTNNIYLISEYCNSGTLRDYLRTREKLSESEAKEILFQITQGMIELNKNNIMHRDLKPENILCHLENGVFTFKICDFGLSTTFSQSDQLFSSSIGSPQYMDLQRLSNEDYGVNSDVFSLGIIAYEMMYGCPPWTAPSWDELKYSMVSQSLKFPFDTFVSDIMKDFIRKALALWEINRASWKDVRNHDFFKRL